MRQRNPLNKFGEVTLDANGNGQVELKPTQYEETWLVTSASIIVAPVPPATVVVREPVFKLFSNGRFIAGTDKGDLNAGGMYEILHSQQPMLGQWSAGDPGAIAQLRLGGWQDIK